MVRFERIEVRDCLLCYSPMHCVIWARSRARSPNRRPSTASSWYPSPIGATVAILCCIFNLVALDAHSCAVLGISARLLWVLRQTLEITQHAVRFVAILEEAEKILA